MLKALSVKSIHIYYVVKSSSKLAEFVHSAIKIKYI